ncbi:hypothetical protein C1879_04235 [Paraeggerthella hongkongensis]|jgi:hypothetical protein|uniref:reverse transcriptase domain-containing protein n=1 Tax=Paraeggerthella sp. TaxID=2897350 RepID=UPI000DF7E1AA|nr:hypothetical protein C1879_04235 [Paraeggerthella hongkongensis]
MKKSDLKWAGCCSRKDDCLSCKQYSLCSSWAVYLDRHKTSKGYSHFDKRTSLASFKTRSKVLDPRWVARHGFWPLIHCRMDRSVFSNPKNEKLNCRKKKTREIRYCAHIDRCIYQRYSFLLDSRYNEFAVNCGIDDSAIAYRTNKKACNIDHAKHAFDFIQSCRRCIILVADFADFFDKVDHMYLKSALCTLLETDKLLPDYYAVFKNTTKYACWDWNSLVDICGLENCRKARKEMNEKEMVLSDEQFRSNVKSCVKTNPNSFGIPQGSPISSVFSNIYLIQFDQEVRRIVDSFSGLYLRYCDDLFVAIPALDEDCSSALAAIDSVLQCIDLQKGVEVKKEKTKLLHYGADALNPNGLLVEIDKAGNVVNEKTRLDYLGFSFDGSSRKIRAKTISKYHYRMRRKAKTVAFQNRGRVNLYGTYSERAIQISKKRSFIDYAKNSAQKMMLNDPESNAIVKHNMEKIAKAINEYSQEKR